MGQNHGKLSKADVKYLTKNTNFSGDQIKDFFERFEVSSHTAFLT